MNWFLKPTGRNSEIIKKPRARLIPPQEVELTREKLILFDKWSTTCKANDFDSLRELLLSEEFKKCSPDRIAVFLNEQKVNSLCSASVLADEYMLTHKAVFPSVSVEKPCYPPALRNNSPKFPSPK